MNKFRIEQIENTHHYRLFIDDIDVSKWTRNVSFNLGVGRVPSISVEFVPETIEVPDNIEALVIAHRDEE